MSDRKIHVGTWCLRGGNHVSIGGECSGKGPGIELVFNKWWSKEEIYEAIAAFEAKFEDDE